MNREQKRLVFALLLAAMLLTAMTACAAPSESSRPIAESEPPVEGISEPRLPDDQPSESGQPYAALVERFYTLVSDPYGFEDIAAYGEFGVIEAARAMEDKALDALGYTIEDISGDGVPELVVDTLPEHGGQVNEVYTLVDGQPQFVFEGWYRSSYSYLGDGRFFYYGSSSASETGRGFYTLTRDGTALTCEEFYFIHAVDGDVSDIRVYYNTTGSWDIAVSKETELSPEGFWAWEPPHHALPLTPFSSYAAEHTAGGPVRVQWAELQLPGIAGYEEFAADDGEYAADVLFAAGRAVTDFELMRLTIREVYDDGTFSYAAEPVYSLERLTPEQPLVVRMAFPGDIPAYGISYVDESGDGMTHHFAVEISGEDGSLLLREIY